MADVIVIGGGLNGLVAGAWLARRRLETVVLEQQPVPGGAAVTGDLAEGVKVPLLSHAIGPIHPDVGRALDLGRVRGIDWISPDPTLTSLGTDDRAIVFHRDPVLTAGSIDRSSPKDSARWQAFVQLAQRLAAVAGEIARHAPPSIDDPNARDWWRLLKSGRRARALGPRDLAQLARWIPMPVADLTSEWFETDLVRAAIAARAIFGNFAGPRSGGTGAMLLQRLAEDPVPVGSGATIRGGPGALTQILADLARKHGATVQTDAHVAKILTRGGAVTGVALADGRELPARAVVAAIDPKQTFLTLTDPADLPPSFLDGIRHYRARGVTAKINLALSEAPAVPAMAGDPVALRGRLLIAPSIDYLERAFDAVKYGEISPAPWLEVSIPSVADHTLAPSGQHVVSIVVHYAPRTLRHGAWADEREHLYRATMRALEPHMPGLEHLIFARQIITPEDLEQHWGLAGGHIFHGDSTIDQAWVARPLLGWAQYATPIDGLFLAGAGTHPGGGLTGLSGLLAAETVERRLKRGRT